MQNLFRKMDLKDDPLKGAYGLSWYERRPSGLSKDEWEKLDEAVAKGQVPDYEYFDWKKNVR